MLQQVYGIKQFQTNLPSLARDLNLTGGRILVTRNSKPALVAMPFEDYQEMEEMILELNSPKLRREIAQARKEYREGKTSSLEEVQKEFDL